MATATIRRVPEDLRTYERLRELARTPIKYVGEPTEDDLGRLDDLCLSPIPDENARLSRETEAGLFRLMNALKRRAQSLRSELDQEDLCLDTLDEIDQLMCRANDIRAWLVEANRRLVLAVASKFVSPRFDHQELAAEGMIPLLRAVELFDADRGFRFSTYATLAIIKHLTRYVQRERTRRDRFQTGRDETVEVLADHRGSESDSAPLIQAEASLHRLIRRLNHREQRVLKARFGLGGHSPQTLSQLGQQMGITKERVRQIEIAARSKLRKLAIADRLDILAF